MAKAVGRTKIAFPVWRVLRWVGAGVLGSAPVLSHAVNFGIYESRAMGMGGAAVASANTENAVYYNPALMAFHDEKEEAGRDGRFFFPTLSVQALENIEDAEDAWDRNLDAQLSASVDAFNADPNAASAQAVADSIQELNGVIEELGNEDYLVDAFAGFSVSEPGAREGGGFYFGTRVVGGGRANVTQEDLDLIDDYVEAMNFVASGGANGEAHPELFDADGNLIDPEETLGSTVDVGAIALTEWGVAAAKEFSIFGRPVALGITPKVKRVDVFREARGYSDGDIDLDENDRTYLSLNVDAGMAMEVGEHFRFGLSIKDLIPESFESGTGREINLRARPRMGVAYVNSWATVGLDVDLAENEPVAGELPSQDASLGVELSPFWDIDLRLGYRHDLSGIREDIVSAGLGYRLGRFVFEAAYAESNELKGAALQLGMTF